MGHTFKNSRRGFSLMEMMISLAIGGTMLGLAMNFFSQGVDATWVVQQRAEMQQDLRAASDMVLKDISLAGSGLPAAQSVALPTGTGLTPIFGYSGVGCTNCAGSTGAGIAYPCASNTGNCVPSLFGVIPAYQAGIKPPGSNTKSDVIAVTYSDTAFALNCYTVTFNNANQVVFTLPAPLTCALPAGLAAPQPVTDPVVGLQPGDLVFFQNQVGGATGQAVAEVTTAVDNGGNTYTVNFNNGDPLKMNQSGAGSGDLAQIIAGKLTVANRILVNTYYLWLEPDPVGGTGKPVLMRQINGRTPVPVAENVVNLQFTYDTYDASGNLLNATGDGGYSTGVSFNLIRKINIAHLTIRSEMAGTRSALMATKGYQTFDYQTSISARNLSYQNRYTLSN